MGYHPSSTHRVIHPRRGASARAPKNACSAAPVAAGSTAPTSAPASRANGPRLPRMHNFSVPAAPRPSQRGPPARSPLQSQTMRGSGGHTVPVASIASAAGSAPTCSRRAGGAWRGARGRGRTRAREERPGVNGGGGSRARWQRGPQARGYARAVRRGRRARTPSVVPRSDDRLQRRTRRSMVHCPRPHPCPAPSANPPGLPCAHTVSVASIASAAGCATGAKTRARSGAASAGAVAAGWGMHARGDEGSEARSSGGVAQRVRDVRRGSAGAGA
jgi:hypothetical protein